MINEFTSGLSAYINGFLEEKRALGYKYEYDERLLHQFDKMCVENFPSINTVTQNAAFMWSTARPNEGKGGLCRRTGTIRELARYINRQGVSAYILPNEYGKDTYHTRIPYVFTQEELLLLFEAAENLKIKESQPITKLEIPILLRLIYACGLRPNEGRTLLRKNIDLESGVILIQNSKRRKDRIVVMDESMLLICRVYDQKIRCIIPNSDYFFPVINDIQSSHGRNWLWNNMRKCLLSAGIIDGTESTYPRPYDLRHTFSTHTMYRWLKEGKNLDNCLPYLSEYMGHECYRYTAYYIHLVPDFFPEILSRVQTKFEYIIPEVQDE